MGCEMTIPKCKFFSPLLSVASLGVALFALLLQTIAFVSHGWAIWTEFENEKEVPGNYISVENSVGLWYSVVCKTGKCEAISHLDGYMESLAKGLHHREVQYSLRIWSQTLYTLGMVCSLVTSVLSVPSLCQSYHRHLKRLSIGVSVFGCVSCCLTVAVIANWGAEQVASRVYHQDMIFSFPWSLLVGGIGGALMGTLGVFHLIVLCRTLETHVERRDSEMPNVYIPLMTQVSTTSRFSANSNTNSESVRNDNVYNRGLSTGSNSNTGTITQPPDILES
ncbi:hypothetical protein FSP39_024979 [Pinctada imbricata]|uniref:Uncharacterized protein n=1 Tax=Pinctada imbricata TaxID=66713 RepID=A0AA88YQA1_PINIB|nr:hypothetical protein FSP39_024979 [Pinctada imbricata]